MATPRKTVDIDITLRSPEQAETVRDLIRTYGGRVDYDCDSFVGARVSKARVSHLKSTATKLGFTYYVYA